MKINWSGRKSPVTHLHALVTDGAFAPDGTFIALPELDDEPFEKLWQKMVGGMNEHSNNE